MNHKRTTILLRLIIAIAVFGMLIGCAQESPSLMEQAFRNQVIENTQQAEATAAELQRTDQITTILCGVGSAVSQTGPQTCTAVFVNGQFLLFDAGNNVVDFMNSINLPLEELDAVFITHFHNDHFADLGEVMENSWLRGRRHILQVYGPNGLTQIVNNFQSAYEFDQSYRTAHHGEEIMPSEWAPSDPFQFTPPADDSALVIYEQDGVTVKAFRVSHPPIAPAVGYRIEYADKIIVISGDTIRTTSLLENSRDADLLVAEAMNMEAIETIENALREAGQPDRATVFFDIRDYHISVEDVGALAQEANVKRLALNHLAPKPQASVQANQMFREPAAEHYSGEIFVGEDGMQIVIPIP